MRKLSQKLVRKLPKKRLDEEIVNRGILKTRSEAKRFIMEGKVMVNGETVSKAGHSVSESDKITLKTPKKYVGRGGLKLEFALDKFNIKVKDRIAGDIGASTGGFTDCLLKRGAKKVYAVDVGYGQLDFSIRNNPRVIVLERTNARYLSKKEIKDDLSLVVMDVSFISILKILPVLNNLTCPDVDIVSLIKPQFEGKPEYLRKGIVKNPEFHRIILKEVSANIKKLGFSVVNATYSPIKGGKGNIEYFYLIRKTGDMIQNDLLYKIIDEAWEKL